MTNIIELIIIKTPNLWTWNYKIWAFWPFTVFSIYLHSSPLFPLDPVWPLLCLQEISFKLSFVHSGSPLTSSVFTKDFTRLPFVHSESCLSSSVFTKIMSQPFLFTVDPVCFVVQLNLIRSKIPSPHKKFCFWMKNCLVLEQNENTTLDIRCIT